MPYPEDPDALSDEEWAEYLFFRDNPKGPFAERWVHSGGCRQWFNARARHPDLRGPRRLHRTATPGRDISRA